MVKLAVEDYQKRLEKQKQEAMKTVTIVTTIQFSTNLIC